MKIEFILLSTNGEFSNKIAFVAKLGHFARGEDNDDSHQFGIINIKSIMGK